MMNHFRSVSRLMRKFAGRGFIFSSVYNSKRGTFEFCWASLNSNIEGFLAVGIVRVINNNKKKNHSHLNMSRSWPLNFTWSQEWSIYALAVNKCSHLRVYFCRKQIGTVSHSIWGNPCEYICFPDYIRHQCLEMTLLWSIWPELMRRQLIADLC